MDNESKDGKNEGVSIQYFDTAYKADERNVDKEVGYPIVKASLPKAAWSLLKQHGIEGLYDASFTLKPSQNGTTIKLTGIIPVTK